MDANNNGIPDDEELNVNGVKVKAKDVFNDPQAYMHFKNMMNVKAGTPGSGEVDGASDDEIDAMGDVANQLFGTPKAKKKEK